MNALCKTLFISNPTPRHIRSPCKMAWRNDGKLPLRVTK